MYVSANLLTFLGSAVVLYLLKIWADCSYYRDLGTKRNRDRGAVPFRERTTPVSVEHKAAELSSSDKS